MANRPSERTGGLFLMKKLQSRVPSTDSKDDYLCTKIKPIEVVGNACKRP